MSTYITKHTNNIIGNGYGDGTGHGFGRSAFFYSISSDGYQIHVLKSEAKFNTNAWWPNPPAKVYSHIILELKIKGAHG